MKKIKLLFSAMALLLVVFTITGCGANKKEKAELKNFKTTSKIVKKATVSAYVPTGKNENYLTKATALYNKKNHTNIKLNITNVTPGPGTTQMISPKLVAHEEMPEIIFIQDTNASGLLQLFSDSFLSASDYGFYEKNRSQFYKPKMETLDEISGGDAMAWPNDYGTAVSYYQPKLFEQAGVNYAELKSWDQLIEAGKKIKEKTGHKLLTLHTVGEVEQVSSIMDQQDMPLFDKNGNLNLATKEGENAAKILQKLIDADLIAWTTDANDEKVKQSVAMILTGSFYATNMQMNFPSAANKWRMGEYIPYSEKNPGKTPASGGSSWYVTKDSKQSLAAAQILSFMTTDSDALEIALSEGLSSANREAFNTPTANKKFEFYGNQQLLKIVAKGNDNGADVNILPYSTDSRAYVSTASYEYWKTKSFAKSYIEEADNFAKKYSIKSNQ